jgi:hypothetical protein
MHEPEVKRAEQQDDPDICVIALMNYVVAGGFESARECGSAPSR